MVDDPIVYNYYLSTLGKIDNTYSGLLEAHVHNQPELEYVEDYIEDLYCKQRWSLAKLMVDNISEKHGIEFNMALRNGEVRLNYPGIFFSNHPKILHVPYYNIGEVEVYG